MKTDFGSLRTPLGCSPKSQSSAFAPRVRRALLALIVLFGVCGAVTAAQPLAVDDTVVAGAVRRALADEFGTAASTIWVEVYRGAVYLSGGAPPAVPRDRIEQIATRVKGVVSVKTEFDASSPNTRLAGR
jgi:hypothetical protein